VNARALNDDTVRLVILCVCRYQTLVRRGSHGSTHFGSPTRRSSFARPTRSTLPWKLILQLRDVCICGGAHMQPFRISLTAARLDCFASSLERR
jgi:hypothetical protein